MHLKIDLATYMECKLNAKNSTNYKIMKRHLIALDLFGLWHHYYQFMVFFTVRAD